MTRHRTCWFALTLLGAAATATALAQPPPVPDRRALLKVHAERLEAAGPANLATIDDELVVTRTGAVSLVSVRRDLLGNTLFTTTFANGTAGPAELAALNAAIAATRPRARGGACQGPGVPLGSSYLYRFTWYGARRASTFEVSFDGDAATACPPEVSALVAISDALQYAVVADPSTTVSSSTCSSDRQCPTGLRCCYPCGVAGCTNVCAHTGAGGECPALP